MRRCVQPLRVVASFAQLLAGQACSSTSSRRAYLLESSQGAEVLKGTVVHLSFGDGALSMEAACNSMSGEYTVEAERVVVKGLMMTEMGCEAQGEAQDAWLGKFLRSKPRLSVNGPRLTFAGDSARLVFLDRERADPDRRLQGTVWEIGQYIDGETAMGLMGIEAPRLTFAADGTWRARGTCLEASGRYQLSAERITLAGTQATTSSTCKDGNDRQAADFVRSVLKDGELTQRIDARDGASVIVLLLALPASTKEPSDAGTHQAREREDRPAGSAGQDGGRDRRQLHQGQVAGSDRGPGGQRDRGRRCDARSR